MTYKAPGKDYREGLTAKEFYEMFPNNESSEAWFVARRWPNGVCCPKCGSLNVKTGAKRKGLPFRCRSKGCEVPFQREVWNLHAVLEDHLSGMALCPLPGCHQLERRIFHEAAS